VRDITLPSLCSVGSRSSEVVGSACPKTSVNNHRRTLRKVPDRVGLLKHRFCCTLTRICSWVCSVSTRIHCELEVRFYFRQVKERHFLQNFRPCTRCTQLLIQWELGTFSLRVELPGREPNSSPTSRSQFKNVRKYNSTPPTPSGRANT